MRFISPMPEAGVLRRTRITMPIAVGPLEWLIMRVAPWLILIVLIAIFVRMGRKRACQIDPDL